MSWKTDSRKRSFGALLRRQWNDFVGTGPGDVFAALLTIAVMFGAMFGCAFATILGADGLQLLLRTH